VSTPTAEAPGLAPACEPATVVRPSGPADGSEAATGIRTTLAERLQSGDVDLPQLPEAAAEVLAATQDVDADARRLVALLDRDPALASHLLRVANAPAYAPRSAIVSLRQAVTHLGVRTVGELALAASLRSGLVVDARHAGDLRAIWAHAAASGGFAREAARLLRAPVEAAFLCGLLHTIGKPVVLRASLELAKEAGVALPPDDLRALVDELHAPAGRLLATSWKLPAAVVAAIATCAAYQRTDEPEPMITALAARLATFLLGPGLEADGLLDHPVFADLNLYPEDVAGLVAKADAVRGLADACAG